MQHVIRIRKLIMHRSHMANNPNSFQNSGVIETGLFDVHKMTLTVMETTFEKLKPNIILYRDYSKFSNDKFREILFHVYQLKILELTVMAWKRFCKYVLTLRTRSLV